MGQEEKKLEKSLFSKSLEEFFKSLRNFLENFFFLARACGDLENWSCCF
jgi:hypothetical protein